MRAFAISFFVKGVLFESTKQAIEATIHLHRDAIHIYIGVAILLVASLWFSHRWTASRVLVPVVIIATLLEVMDLIAAYIGDGLLYGFSVKDVLNTCAIPVLIWFVWMRPSAVTKGHDA